MFRLIISIAFALLLPFSAYSKHTHLVFATFNMTHIIEQHPDHNSGLAIELLDQMAAQLDFTYQVNFYPLTRALDMVRKGKADALIGIYYNDKRAELMDYGKVAIYQDEIRLFSKPELEFTWQGDPLVLNNKSIALLRGGSYGQLLNKQSQNMQVMEVNSVTQQFKLLGKGRVELIASNLRSSSVVLDRLQMQQAFVSHQPALTQVPGYFAFGKNSKHKAMLAQFDQFLLEMEKSGKLKALQQRLYSANNQQ